MFARVLTTHLKPGTFRLATNAFKNEVIPMLKKQKGFKDELAFYDEDREEGVAISFWEKEEDAVRYDREVYPEVKKFLAEAIDGTPELRTYKVSNATWYNLNA